MIAIVVVVVVLLGEGVKLGDSRECVKCQDKNVKTYHTQDKSWQLSFLSRESHTSQIHWLIWIYSRLDVIITK